MRSPFADAKPGAALPGLAGFSHMQSVKSPPEARAEPQVSDWEPVRHEPQAAPPEPHTGAQSEAAHAGSEEFIEHRDPDASIRDHQRDPAPQDFAQHSFDQEPEPQVADLDSFAADELRRYLTTESDASDEPFAAKALSFGEDPEDHPDFTPRLFASNDDNEAVNGYEAEFPSLDDVDDDDAPIPAYGDAFGQDDAVFHADNDADEAEFEQPSFSDFSDGNFADDNFQAAELDEEFDHEQDAPQDNGYDEERGLQPFEAHYDQQPPEVHLGSYPEQEGDASFEEALFADGEGDAEFEGDTSPTKGTRRKGMLVAASLVGALAVGGAVAFAYMGEVPGGSGSDAPPMITADQRPVKTEPTDPGGKTFPHKNKLIYDRLQGGEEQPGQERLVPRQEDVAAAPSTQSLSGEPGNGPQVNTQQVASRSSERATDANPSADASSRRVRTFVVLPDGRVVKPEDNPSQPAQTATINSAQPQQEPASQPASIPGLSVMGPGGSQQPAAPAAQPTQQQAQPQTQPQQLASTQSESGSSPVAAPVRRPAPPQGTQQPTRQAAVQPSQPTSQAATASSGAYVVQVAARKSQTDALAAFADMQQRYPQLLSDYRPIIERADLGDKGVWYRLRVGPMSTKTVASDLCSKLQAAGLRECLVRTQ